MKSKDFPGNPNNLGVRGMRTVADMPAVGGAGARAAMLQQLEDKRMSDLEPTQPLSGEYFASDEVWLQEVATELVDVSPYQPRWFFDEAGLEALATSIQTRGLLKPIILRPLANGRFELIGGERRLRACRLASIQKILCLVRKLDDHEARILAMTDNEQEDLSDYEWGVGYQKALQDGTESSQRSLARSLGVDVSVVSRRLSLTKLPQDIQDILAKKPSLITNNYAKRFIDLAAANDHVVLEVVKEMYECGLQQEAALRKIELKLAEPGSNVSAEAPKKLEGLGSLKVSGKKLELKFDKSVNPVLLSRKIEAFLNSLDASEFHERKVD